MKLLHRIKEFFVAAPRDHADSRENEEINDDTDLNPFDPFPEPISIKIRDVIDLHTIAPRDVKRVVEEYLCEAQRAGFPVVRIIHGKGAGVQREIVRGVLARMSFVRGWTDAPPEAGGWGATIVRLSQESHK